MIVIGCDPSTRAPAFAVHDPRGGSWVIRKFQVPKGEELRDNVIREIGAWLRELAGDPAYGFSEANLVVEDQYLSRALDAKGRPLSNPRSYKALVAARGMIEAAARLAGCEVHEPANPQVWQTAILGTRRGTPRRQVKEAAKLRAQVLTGEKVRDADKADAVCITAYLAHRLTSRGAA